MNTFRPYFHSLCIAIIAGMILSGGVSCTKKVGMTQILVEDSIRHYYPMVQGQDLQLLFRIANVGNAPLIINDIQPSCGCIVTSSNDNNVVPAGRETILAFTYRSERNSGYVHHTIRIFGNIAPKGVTEVTFDTNVVQPALGSPDYEELHKERNEFDVMTGVKTLVDGKESTKGYWTNENEYSRGYNRYYWRNSRK